VLALQDRGLDPRQLAESLHVTHVLEGTVQRVGAQLRVQVRLVNSGDGTTRWSETYDRTMGDVFAVQDDIARDVANALSVSLGAAEDPARQMARRPRLAAWKWYVRGKNPNQQRLGDARDEAIAAFDSAIALDSMFAAPWAGRAWVLLNKAGDRPLDHLEWFARAESSARRSLELDSTLPEGHAALGWVMIAFRRYADAERELRRAVAADPHAHRGWEGLARLDLETRRPAGQLAAARRGLEIDPYSVQALREMALALNTNGRCEESLALLKPAKELSPPSAVAGVVRGLCFLQRKEWQAAIDEFRWAEGNGARAALGLQGYALARNGQELEARRILADLESGRRNSHGAFGIALVQAGLGDYDKAFISLQESAEDKSFRVYIFDPAFKELQRDPRFDRILPFSTQNR
jgi:tetratricopeptide (TPR) repeat protein